MLFLNVKWDPVHLVSNVINKWGRRLETVSLTGHKMKYSIFKCTQ